MCSVYRQGRKHRDIWARIGHNVSMTISTEKKISHQTLGCPKSQLQGQIAGPKCWNRACKQSIKFSAVMWILRADVRNRGNVCFSADQKWMLIDNLTKGFDLYTYPHSSPSDSFPIARNKAFVQQGVFLEDETSVVCGSDHGEIYIYSLGTFKCLQKLKHGSRKTKIQVLNVRSHLTPGSSWTFWCCR